MHILADVKWDQVSALTAVMTVMGTALVFIIDARMDKRFGAFLEKLNGRYLRRDLADEKFGDHRERIVRLENQVEDIRMKSPTPSGRQATAGD